MTTAASKSQSGGPSTSKNYALHATHGATRWHSILQGCRKSEHIRFSRSYSLQRGRVAAICMRLYGGALNREAQRLAYECIIPRIFNKVPRVCGVVRPPPKVYSPALDRVSEVRANSFSVSRRNQDLPSFLLFLRNFHSVLQFVENSGNPLRLESLWRPVQAEFLAT